MEKKYVHLFCCPRCRGNLIEFNTFLKCSVCSCEYKVENGIPRLVLGPKGIDAQISEEKWNKQYSKSSEIKKYMNDPMVISHKQFLSSYKKYFKKNIFLDLGCGVAWASFFLAKEGVSVLGLDISYEAVAKSQLLFKEEKLPGLFIQANFLNIPLKDNSVGFIYWGLSIEYVRNTEKAIRETHRVLKQKGRIVAPFPVVSLSTLFYHQFRGGDIPRVPILRELMELIHVKILKGKYMHYGYGQTFTTSSMRKMFINAGFRVKTIDFFDTYYPIRSFPRLVRPVLQKLLRFRLFWPFAYIEAVK